LWLHLPLQPISFDDGISSRYRRANHVLDSAPQESYHREEAKRGEGDGKHRRGDVHNRRRSREELFGGAPIVGSAVFIFGLRDGKTVKEIDCVIMAS
jgi:hypothetical protein